MSKSMQSLMSAFNEGFQAMQKSKTRLSPEKLAQKKEKTAKKMDKIHNRKMNKR